MIALEKVRDPSLNSEAVVGSGDRCVPGDDSNCGDEGPAIKAKLAHPKGKIQAFLFYSLHWYGYKNANAKY